MGGNLGQNINDNFNNKSKIQQKGKEEIDNTFGQNRVTNKYESKFRYLTNNSNVNTMLNATAPQTNKMMEINEDTGIQSKYEFKYGDTMNIKDMNMNLEKRNKDNIYDTIKMKQLLEKNQIPNKSISPMVMEKDEGKNETTNYIFNSGELYSNFDIKKKKNEAFGKELKTPNNFINNVNNNSSNSTSNNFYEYKSNNTSAIPKEDYKKFSSEKRTYRNSNITNTAMNDYKPKQYQKYGQNEEEDNNSNNNSFTKICNNDGKYQRYSSRKLENEDSDSKYTMGKYPTIRAPMGFDSDNMQKNNIMDKDSFLNKNMNLKPVSGFTQHSIMPQSSTIGEDTINNEFKSFSKY